MTSGRAYHRFAVEVGCRAVALPRQIRTCTRRPGNHELVMVPGPAQSHGWAQRVNGGSSVATILRLRRRTTDQVTVSGGHLATFILSPLGAAVRDALAWSSFASSPEGRRSPSPGRLGLLSSGPCRACPIACGEAVFAHVLLAAKPARLANQRLVVGAIFATG